MGLVRAPWAQAVSKMALSASTPIPKGRIYTGFLARRLMAGHRSLDQIRAVRNRLGGSVFLGKTGPFGVWGLGGLRDFRFCRGGSCPRCVQREEAGRVRRSVPGMDVGSARQWLLSTAPHSRHSGNSPLSSPSFPTCSGTFAVGPSRLPTVMRRSLPDGKRDAAGRRGPRGRSAQRARLVTLLAGSHLTYL